MIARSAGGDLPGPSTMQQAGRKEEDVKAKVHITLKNGVLDPQGKAVQHALGSLGFAGVQDVRQGKFIELDLAETDKAKAKEAVEQMCKQLLANTVIENYTIDLID